jgi:hypothetical protein
MEMAWLPQFGMPLPGADEAWCTRLKLRNWVLAERGHGREWERVFRVGTEEADFIWRLVASAVLTAPIISIREMQHGLVCGVLLD